MSLQQWESGLWVWRGLEMREELGDAVVGIGCVKSGLQWSWELLCGLVEGLLVCRRLEGREELKG